MVYEKKIIRASIDVHLLVTFGRHNSIARCRYYPIKNLGPIRSDLMQIVLITYVFRMFKITINSAEHSLD